jgi:uncharacterized protein YceK
MLCPGDGPGRAAKVMRTSNRAARGAAGAVALALCLVGCQSTRSWQQGCPDVYSGVKYYSDQMPHLPVDGKIFFSIDLLPTLVVDTLALPVTAFLEPERPPGGFPVGCQWAE